MLNASGTDTSRQHAITEMKNQGRTDMDRSLNNDLKKNQKKKPIKSEIEMFILLVIFKGKFLSLASTKNSSLF